MLLVDRTEIYQLRARYPESIVLADELLQRDPHSGDALATKAVALLRLGRPQEALSTLNELTTRYPDKWPDLWLLDADIHYALADYAAAASLATKAAAMMDGSDFRSPLLGTVRLTQAAAEARLGHREEAATALADFHAAVPNVTTLAQIRKWMYPTANLYGYEPLFEGLKLAGVPD